MYKKIEDGIYYPGCLLPSEKELCEAYQASRGTIRRVLDDLSTEGLIYKVKGKGTFIAPTPPNGIQIDSENFSTFHELVRRGKIPIRYLLSAIVITADASLATELGLVEGEKYFKYERVYAFNGTPFSYQVDYFLYKYVEGIEEEHFSLTSIATILKDKAFSKLKCTRLTDIIAVPADNKISHLLFIREGFPLIKAIVRHEIKPNNSAKTDSCAKVSLFYWNSDLFPVHFVNEASDSYNIKEELSL